MRSLQYSKKDLNEVLLKFCLIIEEASTFLRKDNRNYPIRKKFLMSKQKLVAYLYQEGYCIECQEIIQRNENITDRMPYILVKTVFEIENQLVVFHTPKAACTFNYEISVRGNLIVETFPIRNLSFEMPDIIAIMRIFSGIHLLRHYRHKIKLYNEIHDFVSIAWKSSNKLREVNKAIGIFDE